MDPIAFEIGPFAVRWYALLINLGIICALILAYFRVKHANENPDHIFDILVYAIPAGIIGARLYYVAFNVSYYSQYPSEIYKIWHGGLAIHGALIFGILAAYLYTRKKDINFPLWTDLAAPCLPLAQAIGRWGNFVNQEAYGYVTNVPWAMYIDGAYRHPTFLYESFWNLGLVLFLIWYHRHKKKFDSEVMAMYFIGYSLGRFWIEGLRTDSLMLGPLRIAQVVSLLTIIGGTAYIWYRRKALSQNPPPLNNL